MPSLFTNRLLTKAYNQVKEKLGRVPIAREIDKYGEYSLTAYIRAFGNWNLFLSEIGEPVRKRGYISTDDLINAYQELKIKMGHYPSRKEINENGKFSGKIYVKKFGSWSNFLESIGEKPAKSEEQ